jgi:phosphohistidine phosphatase
MRLYLVRHGDALSNLEDSKRSLSPKGEQEVAVIAKFLSQNSITCKQIYHSEKERAKQTADILARCFKVIPQTDLLNGLMPEDPVKPIAEYCNYLQQDTMLVGHLPFMARLAAELLTQREDKPCINFQPAAILCLERVALNQWCLDWLLSPGLGLVKE